jgi:hypothetical protein
MIPIRRLPGRQGLSSSPGRIATPLKSTDAPTEELGVPGHSLFHEIDSGEVSGGDRVQMYERTGAEIAPN